MIGMTRRSCVGGATTASSMEIQRILVTVPIDAQVHLDVRPWEGVSDFGSTPIDDGDLAIEYRVPCSPRPKTSSAQARQKRATASSSLK